MKKRNLTLAILAMVVATLVSVAIVSCKKEDTVAPTGQHAAKAAFTPPQVDDMNAYLKDFKQRMQSAAKGDDEALSLDEAAWHLACLANVDFCKINVEYNDVQFDTVEMQVNASDGAIAMSDLNTAYEQMRNEIQQFKKGFNHCDQNLYFINVFINGSGDARIALMTSFTLGSKGWETHPWYYSDPFELADVCDMYFSEDSVYYWNGLASSELQRILNLYEHHENGSGIDGAVCYIPTRSHTFDYTNTYDPYISGYNYINESRVFAKKYTQPYLYIFHIYEMCYCLDSYLALGYDYINDNLYSHEHPVCWTVTPVTNTPNPYRYYYYHQLHVEYGNSITIPTPATIN